VTTAAIIILLRYRRETDELIKNLEETSSTPDCIAIALKGPVG
jgi:hypothetical protein